MSDIIPISQLPPLTISQAANLDVLPITHDSDIVTYKISLQTLDAFIKTSPSSSKYFSGSIDCAVIATSSLSSSYLTYTGTNNGTSSYSMQSLTSSYSVSSSYVSTSSYANIAAFALSTTQTSINTASLAYTASFLYYNQSGVIPNGTASYAVSGGFAKSSSYSNTASFSQTASYSNTASFSQTASYINPSAVQSNIYMIAMNGNAITPVSISVNLAPGIWQLIVNSNFSIDDPGSYSYRLSQSANVSTYNVTASVYIHRFGGAGFGRTIHGSNITSSQFTLVSPLSSTLYLNLPYTASTDVNYQGGIATLSKIG